MSDQTRSPRPDLTVRTTDDVLALVPYVLGFVPEDSLVMLTAGRESLHARIDLPDDPADLDVVAAQLATAALRNGASKAVVVAYTDDACLAERAALLLAGRLGAAGVPVADAVRVDGGRWYPLDDDPAHPGTAFDLSAHPFTAQAVLDGRVTYRSRAELGDSLVAHDPDEVDRVAAESRQLARCASRRPRSDLVAEGHWVRDRVSRQVAAEDPVPALATEEVARLLVAVRDIEVRDVAWSLVDRSNAGAHVRLWHDVVRRSPVELAAAPCGLLAFSAWMAGDGALAWCAVDRCRDADPDYTMAELVATALENAVPPSSWRPVPPEGLTLFAG